MAIVTPEIKRVENILQSCQVDFQKRPSSDLIWRGTNSQPKNLAPLAKKLMRLTCSNSSQKWTISKFETAPAKKHES